MEKLKHEGTYFRNFTVFNEMFQYVSNIHGYGTRYAAKQNQRMFISLEYELM